MKSSLSRNPLNLNTATAEDFRALGLLDEAQIDSLLRYRSRLRAFASPGELMGVRGLRLSPARWLSLFTYVGDTLVTSLNWRKRCFSGRHSLETRAELPLYRRKGFRPSDREELLRKRSQFFLGPNLGTALRYRYAARRELQWGLSLENDVGEPFAAHGNRPFDHVGGFATYRARSGRWSGLVGDYALAIGEGLLFGHAFFVHPLLELERTAPRQSRFLPNSPSNETQFLRGAVVSGGGGAWRFTGFASHALWDARLRGDSALTLYHAGLHRSLDERAHRHTLGVTTLGARAEWISGRFTAGATTYFAGFSPPVFPSERNYAAGYLRGNHAAGLSLDGGYGGAGREVRGEVAVDGSGNVSAVAFARFHRRAIGSQSCRRAYSPPAMWPPMRVWAKTAVGRRMRPAFRWPCAIPACATVFCVVLSMLFVTHVPLFARQLLLWAWRPGWSGSIIAEPGADCCAIV